MGKMTSLKPSECANLCWVHQVHKCLHDGVIRCIHVRVEREIAFAGAVKRAVAIRRDDPVLPFEVLKAHVERLNLTAFRVVIAVEGERISVFGLLLAFWLVSLALGACVVVSDVLFRFDHLKCG